MFPERAGSGQTIRCAMCMRTDLFRVRDQLISLPTLRRDATQRGLDPVSICVFSVSVFLIVFSYLPPSISPSITLSLSLSLALSLSLSLLLSFCLSVSLSLMSDIHTQCTAQARVGLAPLSFLRASYCQTHLVNRRVLAARCFSFLREQGHLRGHVRR